MMNVTLEKVNGFTEIMRKIEACDVAMADYAKSKFRLAEDRTLVRQPVFPFDAYDLSGNEARLKEISTMMLQGEVLKNFSDSAFYSVIQKTLTRAIIKVLTLEWMQGYCQTGAEEYQKLIISGNEILNRLPDEQIYRQLYENPDIDAMKVFGPTPEVFQKFKTFVEDKLAKSLARVDMDKETYSFQEVQDLMDTVFREDFGFEIDFRAEEVHSKKNMLGVSTLDRFDQLGSVVGVLFRNAKEVGGTCYLTPDIVRAKVIGGACYGWAYRTAFMCQEHPELAMSLPGCEVFDTGVVTCLEQVLNPKGASVSLELGVENYVMCGLAYCDGNDLQTTFQKYCEYYKKRTQVQDLDKKTLGRILRQVERCYYGTGMIPWTVGTAYLDGPMEVWKFINERKDCFDKAWALMLEAGKTNPSLPLHQDLLKMYGWSDEDFRA